MKKIENEKLVLIAVTLFNILFARFCSALRPDGEIQSVRRHNEDPTQVLMSIALLVNDKSSSDRRNVPRDFYSIRDGLNVYPPRAGQINESSSAPSEACGYSKQTSLQLLESIEKAVANFYGRTAGIKRTFVDAGYGLRFLGGQINYIISKISYSKELKHLEGYFYGMSNQSMALAEAIIKQAITDNPDLDKSYARGFKLMLERDFLLHPVNPAWRSSQRIVDQFSDYNESMIADGIEVIYPYLDFHCRVALVSGCEVPLVCRKMYLEDIYSQYMLTHQLLYLQYASKAGCMEQKPEIFKDAELRIDKMCAKMYLEAEFLEKHGLSTRYIDLFAEQVGFCGLAGYPNFLKEDWLREILSWQSKSDSGCFIDHYKDDMMTDQVITIKSKMSDGEVIEEDCLAHLTAVGMMALSVNLRRIVDTCPEDYFREYEPRYWKQ